MNKKAKDICDWALIYEYARSMETYLDDNDEEDLRACIERVKELSIEHGGNRIGQLMHDDKIDIFHYYSSVAEQFKMAINSIYGLPHISLKIENIISNDPATVIFWNDGSKTVVKAEDGDSFDLEKGILYASLKKYTNKKEYDNILRTIDLIKED